MSIDRRESLLAQLVVVMQTAVPGIRNVYRNQTDVSASQRPAIVVLDADEMGAAGAFALGRPAGAPSIMHMSPQICLMAGGLAANVGTILNGFRAAVIAAVLSDFALADLVSTIGGIQYQGCVTDLGQGRTMEGLMILNFEMHYPLFPAELS